MKSTRHTHFFALLFATLAASSFVQAQKVDYKTLLLRIAHTPAMERARMLHRAASEAAAASEGETMPTLDLTFRGAWLNDTPTMYIHTQQGATLPLPMATRRSFTGAVTLRYPLFTGGALDALVARKYAEANRARLEMRDAQRNLYMRTTELYGVVLSQRIRLRALYRALDAFDKAYEKAEAMLAKGLLAPSQLYRIEAQRYAVKADIKAVREEIEAAKAQLGYLTGTKVDTLKTELHIPKPPPLQTLVDIAMRRRSDIRALETLLQADKANVRAAQSRFYPSVGIEAALKRHGDTLSLNGDGYTNADQSYIGAQAEWNLFNGGSDTHRLQAARYKHLADEAALQDYRRKVRTEIENAYVHLQTLLARYEAARKHLKAQKAYVALTKGRFENRFADADELSRAVADLAAAKAQEGALRYAIAVQRAKLWLLGGLDAFKRALRLSSR
jgi:outer membrane protein TolC